MYTEEELLMLSGIQHMAFCPRQWALIHIEQIWAENVLTVEGQHLHQRVDDPFASGQLVDKTVLRSMSIVSFNLGLYGRADVVELLLANSDELPNTVQLKGKRGRWFIHPVEYKRGKPKTDICDEVQLCAQAICLEEMFNVSIPKGSLFYGETRHRHEVVFGKDIRDNVIVYGLQMHELYRNGKTPKAVFSAKCKSCSLYNDCLPKSMTGELSANSYLNQNFSSNNQ